LSYLIASYKKLRSNILNGHVFEVVHKNEFNLQFSFKVLFYIC